MADLCGGAIGSANDAGRSGCLVQYKGNPHMVLMLTALHVLVGANAKRGDPVASLASPGTTLGALRNWSNLDDGDTTVDAALVWIDPEKVSAQIVGLGAPSATTNPTPQVGDAVHLCPAIVGAAVRTSTIQQLGQSVDITVSADGWRLEDFTYQKQILCSPMISEAGDSGAVVLDAQNRVVGMVVAGVPEAMFQGQACSQTVITPIDAILSHPAFAGQLEVLAAIPPEALAPSAPAPAAPAPAPGAPPATAPTPGALSGFGSLVPGGFFSATPFDLSVARSIRTNNPGALNFSNWQQTRPGYVGRTQPDGSANHNVTTIYRTPEHGVASWYHLLSAVYGFGTLASFTLLQLAQRYSGQQAGSAVDAYIAGWGAGSGGALKAGSSFAVGDDAQMLALAKAMFFNEIGAATPLHDDQIAYGVTHERAGNLPG